MRSVIERVIESKNYELSDMLKKIDTLWVQGSIGEEAREALYSKARMNANVENSLNIITKLEDLDKRLKRLEEERVNIETEEPSEDVIESYVAGKWYYAGNKVLFEGKTYECIAPEGVVCVWSPTEYPTYWQEES